MTTSKLSRRSALAAGLSSLFWPHPARPLTEDREVEGGIGGTGIVGILTGTEDLIVSGNRLLIGNRTEFSDGFGRLARADIQLGDSLTVEASGPEDALVAQRVHVTTPLVGVVSAISGDGRLLVVNGVTVIRPTRATGLMVGDRVAVSGLWRGQDVVASRISPARNTLDLVSGDVLRSGRGVTIGPVPIRGRGLSSLGDGSFASAIGRFDPASGLLRSSDLTTARFIGAAGPLERLSIEGYLTPTPRAPGYRIAGLGHSFERNLDLARYAETRVLFNGAYTGRFAAETAVVLPESEDARRNVLLRIANG